MKPYQFRLIRCNGKEIYWMGVTSTPSMSIELTWMRSMMSNWRIPVFTPLRHQSTLSNNPRTIWNTLYPTMKNVFHRHRQLSLTIFRVIYLKTPQLTLTNLWFHSMSFQQLTGTLKQLRPREKFRLWPCLALMYGWIQERCTWLDNTSRWLARGYSGRKSKCRISMVQNLAWHMSNNHWICWRWKAMNCILGQMGHWGWVVMKDGTLRIPGFSTQLLSRRPMRASEFHL